MIRSLFRKPIASVVIQSRSRDEVNMNTKILARYWSLILAGCLILFINSQSVFGDDAWRTDFDATCAQSNNAMTLSISDLKMLVERCDHLQKIIEAQEETVRKVYSKRLQMCKSLYVFVLEAKMQEQQPNK